MVLNIALFLVHIMVSEKPFAIGGTNFKHVIFCSKGGHFTLLNPISEAVIQMDQRQADFVGFFKAHTIFVD